MRTVPSGDCMHVRMHAPTHFSTQTICVYACTRTHAQTQPACIHASVTKGGTAGHCTQYLNLYVHALANLGTVNGDLPDKCTIFDGAYTILYVLQVSAYALSQHSASGSELRRLQLLS